MTITIDKARAIELLEQAVAERGEDYLYPRSLRGGKCFYVNPEDQQTPDCLVGLVLHKAGLSIEDLYLQGDRGGVDEADEANGIAGPIVRASDQLVDALNELGLALIDEDAKDVLVTAQNRQDGGLTWGAALQDARDLTNSFAY